MFESMFDIFHQLSGSFPVYEMTSDNTCILYAIYPRDGNRRMVAH